MNYIRVGFGAACGALARYGINFLIQGALGILIINMLACFIMGYKKPGLFWGAGFLGGMSTFSTYIVYSYHDYAYMLCTVFLCIAAYLVGSFLEKSKGIA